MLDRILVVDDDEDIRKQLKWGLGRDYDLQVAGDAREALSLFRKYQPKVVTLDLGLPPAETGSEEGFRLLGEILSNSLDTKVIIITGSDEREHALKAVQMGAYDFYQKPIDLGELKIIIKRALHLRKIEEENSRLHHVIEQKQGINGILGQCPQMQQIFSTIRKVASSDVPVLVNGGSGTGKELVARAIHSKSLRKDGPFIPINCGAIPDNLLEAELFGYEKGAFTGAHTRVQGKVEFAHKGTLFLDEIGELPANLQVKLLRYLQEKILQRVGGRIDIVVDARIISATNIDIAKAIQEGAFREDLFYRIAVVTMNLPPLMERGEDIMLLANFFLKRFSDEFKKRVKGFSPASVDYILSYDWPGNVRELENRVQRAVIMSESVLLEPYDLGFSDKVQRRKTPLSDGVTLRDARDKVEREMIINAVRNQRGNIAKAAEMLGISRPTLYDLMKKHSLHNLA